MEIKDINIDTGEAIIEGEIFHLETREIKGNRKLISFNMTDTTDSMTVKVFLREGQYEDFETNIKEGSYIRV